MNKASQEELLEEEMKQEVMEEELLEEVVEEMMEVEKELLKEEEVMEEEELMEEEVMEEWGVGEVEDVEEGQERDRDIDRTSQYIFTLMQNMHIFTPICSFRSLYSHLSTFIIFIIILIPI